MRKKIASVLLLGSVFFGRPVLCADWQILQTGFEFRRLPESQVYFFRIDPGKFRLDLLLASDTAKNTPVLTAAGFRQKNSQALGKDALLIVNGGFFDETNRSLGLLQRKGKILNPLRDTAWGIFLMGGKDGRTPAVISRKDWRPENVSMAIQVGPRLVIGGQIPALKESAPTRRSAIGITGDGWIEIALAESPLTMQDWASILQKDCVQALNLDGGGSSQISVKLPNFSLEVSGATAVPNAIAVFAKETQ